MTLLGCEAVRERLEAHYDNELSLDDRLIVVEHLALCWRCVAELREIETVRAAVKTALRPPAQADGLAGMVSTVLTRARLEREASWPARVGQALEDMHLVWSALAATVALVTCVALGSAVLRMTADEQAGSLAGLISTLAAPEGERPSALPASVQRPRLPAWGGFAELVDGTLAEGPDLVLALAAVVTKDGRVRQPAVLMADQNDRDTYLRLVRALQEAQLVPASRDGSPVAVHFVWVLAHTTVRPASLS
jgi:hypothetical protein